MKINLSPFPTRWIKRVHGHYSRNRDLLTIKTAEQLVEELQNEHELGVQDTLSRKEFKKLIVESVKEGIKPDRSYNERRN